MTISVDKSSNEAVFSEIKNIIVSVFFNPKYYNHNTEPTRTLIRNLNIEPARKLVQDLHMDSIYLIEFVMALEEQYKFKVTEAQFDKISTVGDVVELVAKIQRGVEFSDNS